ncbi:I78 family peptidase inhibitor [Pseudooceanicola sp. LIPI14-2-Ac024]|uniref:I78 family peptidase inhibitor n=1 Tax=Pseudooceanicola sp. LIPI14-2-Ac024 TaxID=3344875 RepID=UPI0035D11CC4
MKKFGFSALALVALAACEMPAATTPPASSLPPEDACGASQLQGYVGQPFSQAMVPPGADPVRILLPSTPATMDYRPDRLNFILDQNGTVSQVKCT